MNVATTVVVLSLAAGTFLQVPVKKEPPIVERLCGKLVYSEEVPVKGQNSTFKSVQKNLAHVPVHLFRATDDESCCEGRTPASSTRTGHWGGFALQSKELPAGSYWLEIESSGHKSKMLIHFAPKKYSTQLCTETEWDVDKAGNLTKPEFIVVD